MILNFKVAAMGFWSKLQEFVVPNRKELVVNKSKMTLDRGGHCLTKKKRTKFKC
jgi:hypothetical protein